jgi:hypothetical protein
MINGLTFRSLKPVLFVLLTIALMTQLFPLAAEAVGAAGTVPLVPATIAEWTVSEEGTTELVLGNDRLEFYPQSLATDGKKLFILNRFTPAIVRFSIESGTIESIIRLKQDSDKKFDARFFTCISLSKTGFMVFEQSTGTLRAAASNGTISDYWPVTNADGSIIESFFPLDEKNFFFFDSGLEKGYVRDISRNTIKEDPDNAGDSFVVQADGIILSKKMLALLAEREEGGFEVNLTPASRDEDIQALAEWPDATDAEALFADAQGKLYFYIERAQGQTIEIVSPPANGPAIVKSVPVARLSFSERATSPAAILIGKKAIFILEAASRVSLSAIELEAN